MKKEQSSVIQGLARQAKTVATDTVPAKLTENEYVIPADVVIALGKGEVAKGIQILDSLVKRVRDETQGMLTKMRG